MKIKQLLEEIKDIDNNACECARQHWLDVAKPLFSLGRLEDMIIKIAGIKGNECFSLDKKAVLVMCADNGVVDEGVTQTGQQMTAIVSENFTKGDASVCIMAQMAGADVFAVDVGISSDVVGLTDKNTKVAYGTQNMAIGAAMTREQTVAAILLGVNKVKQLSTLGYDIIATGEMGIGNTTTSSAIAAVLLGLPVEKVTGRGAGLSSEGFERKIEVIKQAIRVNQPDNNDVIDVVTKVGGLDIAALIGVFIGGAVYGVPIVLDGFISAVSAVAAVQLCPKIVQYILPSHLSKEPAARLVLEKLGLEPVITADMCLGEGTGAVALFPLVDMAHGVYRKLHTFYNWNGNEIYKILK